MTKRVLNLSTNSISPFLSVKENELDCWACKILEFELKSYLPASVFVCSYRSKAPLLSASAKPHIIGWPVSGWPDDR
ncbi:MAG: hypothetical protein AB8B49_09935 [Nitratireductor sp.]